MKYFEECVITEVKQQSKTKPPHYDQDQKHLTCNEDVKDAVGEDAAKTMKEPGTSNVTEIYIWYLFARFEILRFLMGSWSHEHHKN